MMFCLKAICLTAVSDSASERCISLACRDDPGDLYSLTAIYKSEVQRKAAEWTRAWCVRKPPCCGLSLYI